MFTMDTWSMWTHAMKGYKELSQLLLGESNVARYRDDEVRIQCALKLANVDLGW